MNGFQIECYIGDNDTQNTKLSNFDEKELQTWKKDIEKRVLSEYHNKKIIIKGEKI